MSWTLSSAESGSRGRLSGAWNFRDLGSGPGGGIVSGRLFRSSALSGLDDNGRQTLLDLGVSRIVDLRSRRELESEGADNVPDGIDVLLRPFEREQAEGIHVQPRLSGDDERFAHMVKAYRSFVRLDGVPAAIRAVVEALTDRGAGAVLVHCAAGKDRTGWVIAMVLAAADIDRLVIMDDFLRSNDAIDVLREYQRGRGMNADSSDLLLGVRAEYLEAAFHSVVDTYGSVYAYMDSIGIGRAERQDLRTVLTSQP